MSRFKSIPEPGNNEKVAEKAASFVETLAEAGFRTDALGLALLGFAVLLGLYLVVRASIDWYVAFNAQDTMGQVIDFDVSEERGERAVIAYRDHKGRPHRFVTAMEQARKMYELERFVRVTFYPEHPDDGWLAPPRGPTIVMRLGQATVMVACLVAAGWG